jgi:hypothetical protein
MLVAEQHRVRLAAAAAVILADGGQGPQGPKENLNNPFSWEAHVRRMTEKSFKLRYRVSYDAFKELLSLIGSALNVNQTYAALNKWGEVVRPQTKLAIALRYFAGGSPLDLELIYHVVKSSVMNCVWLVVDAINAQLDNICFPVGDRAKLELLEAEFRAGSHGGFWSGQVGAVDGVHFKMRCPSKHDVSNPLRYYVTRKAEYAMLAIAVCDYNRRFTFVDISHAPQTHDSLAFEASDLGWLVAQGELPAPFFLNGDSAFTLGPCMITPSGEAALDDFDFFQSSNRMAIECAFGILIRRWGVLWRPLDQRFDRRALLLEALMRLHNFCISKNIEDDTRDENGLSEIQPNRWARTPLFDKEGRPVHHLNTQHDVDHLESSGPQCRLRDKKRRIGQVGDPQGRDGGRGVFNHAALPSCSFPVVADPTPIKPINPFQDKKSRRDELAAQVAAAGYARPAGLDSRRAPRRNRGVQSNQL